MRYPNAVGAINIINVSLLIALGIAVTAPTVQPDQFVTYAPPPALEVIWPKRELIVYPEVATVSGIDLIKRFEGLRLKAYKCTAKRWTIGYGRAYGVKSGQVITQADADRMLSVDYAKTKSAVLSAVKADISDQQIEVLVSFAYNVGITRFKESTMLKMINAGDLRGARDQFRFWIHVDGQPIDGLINRRAEEAALFI